MALIRCDECGHNVSDRATACARCGAPVAVPIAELVPVATGGAATRTAVFGGHSPWVSGLIVVACFIGLGLAYRLANWIGAVGAYYAAALGAVGLIAGVGLAFTYRRGRAFSVAGAVFCVLVLVIGWEAGGDRRREAKEQAVAARVRLAEGTMQKSRLRQLASAQPDEAYPLCIDLAAHGGVPPEGAVQCASAYLAKGQEDEKNSNLAAAWDAMKQAAMLQPDDPAVRAARVRVAVTIAVPFAERGLRESEAKMKTGEPAEAVSLAQKAREDLRKATDLGATDPRALALGDRIDAQLVKAHAAHQTARKKAAAKEQSDLRASIAASLETSFLKHGMNASVRARGGALMIWWVLCNRATMYQLLNGSASDGMWSDLDRGAFLARLRAAGISEVHCVEPSSGSEVVTQLN